MVEGGLDASIMIEVSTPADLYIDGELRESLESGDQRSILVSSKRAHTLELRSPEGNKTFTNLKPNPFGYLDLGTWKLVGSNWVESN